MISKSTIGKLVRSVSNLNTQESITSQTFCSANSFFIRFTFSSLCLILSAICSFSLLSLSSFSNSSFLILSSISFFLSDFFLHVSFLFSNSIHFVLLLISGPFFLFSFFYPNTFPLTLSL